MIAFESADFQPGGSAAAYDYHDENGKLLFQVRRTPDKRFFQYRPDPNRPGQFISGVKGVRRVPYRLPDLLKAHPESILWVVEGEKDADNLWAIRLSATCNPGGAGNWDKLDSAAVERVFRNRIVAIVPDNDQKGRDHAQDVAGRLHDIASEIRIVELPGVPEKGDASDLLDSLGTDNPEGNANVFLRLFDIAEPWAPAVGDSYEGEDAFDDPAEWPDLIPIDASGGFAGFAGLPLHGWPAWMADYIRGLATETQTPPALSGLLVLSAAGAGLAGRVDIQAYPSWKPEPLNLYTVTALAPSERKSSVFADVMRPIRELEDQLEIDQRMERNRLETEQAILESRLKAKRGEAAKAAETGERAALNHECAEIANELRSLHIPSEVHLVVDDLTQEALSLQLAKQDGRLLVAAAEGTIFSIAAGRYSEGKSNFDVFLKGFSREPLKDIRIGRDTVRCNKPTLSIATTVQPIVMDKLFADPTSAASGFLSRFIFAIPEPMAGRRDIRPPAMPEHIREIYHDRMRALWQSEPNVESGLKVPHVLQLTSEAADMLAEFETWIEPQLDPNGGELAVAGWGGKLVGITLRVAGIFHVASSITDNNELRFPRMVGVEPVQAAIQFAKDFIIPHGKVAFRVFAVDPDIRRARRVLDWIMRRREMEFRARDVIANLSGADFERIEIATATLERLAKHGYVRQRQTPRTHPTGPAPSPTWEVHPDVVRQFRWEPWESSSKSSKSKSRV